MNNNKFNFFKSVKHFYFPTGTWKTKGLMLKQRSNLLMIAGSSTTTECRGLVRGRLPRATSELKCCNLIGRPWWISSYQTPLTVSCLFCDYWWLSECFQVKFYKAGIILARSELI